MISISRTVAFFSLQMSTNDCISFFTVIVFFFHNKIVAKYRVIQRLRFSGRYYQLIVHKPLRELSRLFTTNSLLNTGPYSDPAVGAASRSFTNRYVSYRYRIFS
jgi:hypothetical protein